MKWKQIGTSLFSSRRWVLTNNLVTREKRPGTRLVPEIKIVRWSGEISKILKLFFLFFENIWHCEENSSQEDRMIQFYFLSIQRFFYFRVWSVTTVLRF